MIKYIDQVIFRLVAKKVKFNGHTFFQSPDSGWRKSIFEKLSVRAFERSHRNVDKFRIEGLEKFLMKTEASFKEKNHACQIDIYKGPINDLQIIHPFTISDKIQKERFNEFGFMIYITFDPTIKGNKVLHKKFKQLKNYSDYFHFIHDEAVDCYGLECGLDKKKVVNHSRILLTDVLGHDNNDKYYFDISSHGKIGNHMHKEIDK